MTLPLWLIIAVVAIIAGFVCIAVAIPDGDEDEDTRPTTSSLVLGLVGLVLMFTAVGIAAGSSLSSCSIHITDSETQMNKQQIEECADDLMQTLSMGRGTAPGVADAFQAIIARHVAAAEGWQPIATAPKVGWILGLMRNSRTQTVIRRSGRDWIDDNLLCRDPTHWQPLPVPPAKGGDDAG